MRLFQGEAIALHCDHYSATLAPAAGGRVSSLAWSEGGLSCPLLVAWDGQAFDEHAWPKAGAFPMLPFANRIAPDGFGFRGRVIRPEPGPGGFALHGLAHRRPWTVISTSVDHARMRLVHEPTEPGWPWAWTAEQDVRVDEHGLQVKLTVRNDAMEPMPVAIGWHPYHPVPTDMRPGDLHFNAAARHDLDGQGCAAGEGGPPGCAMEAGETAAFARWSGQVGIQSICVGRIAVRCQGATGLVLHRPASGNYLCAEPVTLLPGHLGRHAEEGGVGVLTPGAERTMTWTCAYDDRQHTSTKR